MFRFKYKIFMFGTVIHVDLQSEYHIIQLICDEQEKRNSSEFSLMDITRIISRLDIFNNNILSNRNLWSKLFNAHQLILNSLVDLFTRFFKHSKERTTVLNKFFSKISRDIVHASWSTHKANIKEWERQHYITTQKLKNYSKPFRNHSTSNNGNNRNNLHSNSHPFDPSSWALWFDWVLLVVHNWPTRVFNLVGSYMHTSHHY